MSDQTSAIDDAPITRFTDALVAPGPQPSSPDRMRLFGQLVGTWATRSQRLDEPTGDWHESRATWTFAYILDGRAVQDVLVATDADGASTLGTTIRAYDAALGVWRVSWFGPAIGEFCTLVASGHRDGIRQDGTQTDGRLIRWNVTAIKPESFAVDNWVSDNGGADWWLEQHLDATRLA